MNHFDQLFATPQEGYSRWHLKVESLTQRLAHYSYVTLGAILFPVYIYFYVFESSLSFTALSNLELVFFLVSAILIIQMFLRTRKLGKKWYSALALVLRSYGIGLFAYSALFGVSFFALGLWSEVYYGSSWFDPGRTAEQLFFEMALVSFYISHFFILIQLYLQRPPKLARIDKKQTEQPNEEKVMTENKEVFDEDR